MNKALLVIGLIVFFMGILWIGQGLGYIRWPAESFMISQQRWALYGAIVAAVGLVVIFFSR